MPKATTPVAAGRQARRHNPLEDDLVATGPLREKSGKRKSRHDIQEDEKFVDSKASRKILKIGQELADEDQAESTPEQQNLAFNFESRFGAGEDEEEETYENEDAWGDEDEVVEEVEIDPEDLETYSKFFPAEEDSAAVLRKGAFFGGADEPEEEGQGGTNLADLILQRIAEHEAMQARKDGGLPEPGPIDEEYELPPKVVEVYTKIGLFLSRYKSGKLPKPFKILPTVPHWEDILDITRPESWSTNACYEATKIFISSTPIVAQRFMEMVLLPRVQLDIEETKKLNVHLFNSLKKGLYKPAAWFKGFLFPLINDNRCTLRHAHIISAVLVRVSVPVLHSAAALKGLCDIAAQESSPESEKTGATNVFIKALLEKKYALPYQVIDSLVFHFLRWKVADQTMNVDGAAAAKANAVKLPVIWHQSLLAFAQRYRNDITEDQREALLDLLLTKGHASIGPEIRRELLEGRGRGVMLEPEAAPGNGGDDTMMMD